MSRAKWYYAIARTSYETREYGTLSAAAQLALAKDEGYIVSDCTPYAGWWPARNQHGEQGFVPVSCLTLGERCKCTVG